MQATNLKEVWPLDRGMDWNAIILNFQRRYVKQKSGFRAWPPSPFYVVSLKLSAHWVRMALAGGKAQTPFLTMGAHTGRGCPHFLQY